MIGKACQLIPAYFDAEPQFWDRSYAKNMRPIRGYPNYWRIDDDEAFIDGPISQGEKYVRDLYIWKVEIIRDDSYKLSNVFKLTNTRERISYSDQEVNGETVSTYNYTDLPADFTYNHTNIVNSVSLEFDQSGRRLIAFESTGDVYFLWFDPVVSTQVVNNFGAGYNPVVVTDTYRRRGGSADSERLLFYVDGNTRQIVYRKQLDRYGILYTLPNAPANIVELLKVSKNIYGGLTALYCYDDGAGNLLTGSFTARSGVNEVNIGTDGRIVSASNAEGGTATVLDFGLKDVIVTLSPVESSAILSEGTGSVLSFNIRDVKVLTDEQTDTNVLNNGVGSILNFNVKDVRVLTEEQTDSSTLTPTDTSGTVLSFNVKDVLIEVSAPLEAATLATGTASILNFSLG